MYARTTRWLAVACLTLAALVAAPSAASATSACPGSCGSFEGPVARPVPTNYVGWAAFTPDAPDCRAAICVGEELTAPAWRWTGTSWRPAYLPGGFVYVYPYSGDWRWAWTARTGWVAIYGAHFYRA